MEVKFYSGDSDATSDLMGHLGEQIGAFSEFGDAVFELFGEAILPILIFIVPNKSSTSNFVGSISGKRGSKCHIYQFYWDGNDPLPTAEFYTEIRKFLVTAASEVISKFPENMSAIQILNSPITLDWTDLAAFLGKKDKESVKLSTHPLADVFSSFRNFLSEVEYQNLELEITGFVSEYESEHYTACATRIGRTIEFVLYCLSDAWGVTVNKQSIELVDKAQVALDQLKMSYIRLANASEDQPKSVFLTQVQNDIRELNGRIEDLTFNMHLDLTTQDIDSPPEPNAILRSIAREYGKGATTYNKTVRGEIRALAGSKDSPIRLMYNLRNKASHADWAGKYRDVTKSEVDDMIKQIRIIILKLVNIGEAITQLKSITP